MILEGVFLSLYSSCKVKKIWSDFLETTSTDITWQKEEIQKYHELLQDEQGWKYKMGKCSTDKTCQDFTQMLKSKKKKKIK